MTPCIFNLSTRCRRVVSWRRHSCQLYCFIV